MSLRLPQNLPNSLSAESNTSAINVEIAGEKAAALGRSARQMERALKMLKSAGDSGSDQGAALRAASDAVYHFFIQRELCGFANHDEPIERYGIPNAVLLRLGAG